MSMCLPGKSLFLGYFIVFKDICVLLSTMATGCAFFCGDLNLADHENLNPAGKHTVFSYNNRSENRFRGNLPPSARLSFYPK